MTLKNKFYSLLLPLFLLLATLACSLSNNGDNNSTSNPPIQSDGPSSSLDSASTDAPAVPVINPNLQVSRLEIEGLLIDIYPRINPSVVHILVYARPGDAEPLGSGSGFVYDADGRIVTNNHVVEGGSRYEVVFYDNQRRRAEVVGRDVDSDLAVIAVDELPPGIQPLPLGNSDELLVGQMVIAIGNPFGEQGSMSLGIISGLGRSLESQRTLEDSFGRYTLPEVIQTDAPINPGNSGGPLLDLTGRVVGVNSAIRSTTGFNSGVGFSIPVNAVHRIVPALIADGEYAYSYMGVQIQSLNLNLVERYRLSQVNGAYVTAVTEGSPADEAGLIPGSSTNLTGGDLIIAVDGQPINDTEELIAYLVFKTEVGQVIDLTVLRDEEQVIVPLTLGERP